MAGEAIWPRSHGVRMPRARRQPQPGRRPDARRNHVPFVRTRLHADAVRYSPAHCRRKREGATQFPTIGLFERTRIILKEPETRGSEIVVISRGTGSSSLVP